MNIHQYREVQVIESSPWVAPSTFHDSHSPTKREERKQYGGSIPERVPGKQGEIPRPLGPKRRRSLLGPGLALGY